MPNNFFAHLTAVVDEGAVVGDGTRIWHGSHICATAVIGANCNLGQNVYVDNRVRIGNDVKIQNNVSVYEGVQLGDEVFIGPSVVFTNVLNPRSFIDRKNEFKPTLVGRGASIGANATIVCGICIGVYAMVGAGSVVTGDVLPFALVYGNPAKQYGWVSKAGQKLIFETTEAVCPQTGERYRLINNEVQLL